MPGAKGAFQATNRTLDMKITYFAIGALLLCPLMPLSASEENIRAEAERKYKEYMAIFDATLDKNLRQEYHQIVADAVEVRPELQQGFIRDRYAEAQAIGREQRDAYSEKVWAILSEEMDKAIDNHRWGELNRKLDQLQATVSDQINLRRKPLP